MEPETIPDRARMPLRGDLNGQKTQQKRGEHPTAHLHFERKRRQHGAKLAFKIEPTSMKIGAKIKIEFGFDSAWFLEATYCQVGTGIGLVIDVNLEQQF